MPADTDILNECLVPHCGISMDKSAMSMMFCCTPSTSFPNTITVFSFFH